MSTQLIRLVLYFIITGGTGLLLIQLISPKLSIGMKIGIAVFLGLFLNSLIFVILSLFFKEVVWTSIMGLDFLFLFFMCVYALRERSSSLIVEMRDAIKAANYNIFEICLFVVIVLLLLSVFYKTLITPFYGADEFSYWGRAARALFQFKNAGISGLGFSAFERYPLFIPASASLIAQATGVFFENMVKLINPIVLTASVIFLGAFFKKIKLNRIESMLAIIIYLTIGRMFTLMSCVLYADVPFAVFYGVAVGLFYLYTIEREKSYLFLSGLLFALTAWTKIDGTIISLATIVLLIGVDYFLAGGAKVRGKLMDYGLVVLPVFVYLVFWGVVVRTFHLGHASWEDNLFVNTPAVLRSLWAMLHNSFIKLLNTNFFTLFWIILAVIVVLALFFLFKFAYLYFLVPVVVNLGYIYASYVFVLPASESIGASSFERWLLHIGVVGIMLFMEIYLAFKERVIAHVK